MSGAPFSDGSCMNTYIHTYIHTYLHTCTIHPQNNRQIRRVVRTAIFVNLLGLLTSLIGAEQFVGNLMARVLQQQVRGVLKGKSLSSQLLLLCRQKGAYSLVDCLHAYLLSRWFVKQGGFSPLIVTNNAAQLTAPTVQPIDIFVIQVCMYVCM